MRVVELRHIARELLAERERRGVLQVRAADLDDVGEGVGFRAQRRRSAVSAGSRRRVTASTAATFMAVGKTSLDDWPAVDVVVGVHEAPLAALRRRAARWRGWRAPR